MLRGTEGSGVPHTGLGVALVLGGEALEVEVHATVDGADVLTDAADMLALR